MGYDATGRGYDAQGNPTNAFISTEAWRNALTSPGHGHKDEQYDADPGSPSRKNVIDEMGNLLGTMETPVSKPTPEAVAAYHAGGGDDSGPPAGHVRSGAPSTPVSVAPAYTPTAGDPGEQAGYDNRPSGNRQGSGTSGQAQSGEFVSSDHDWSAPKQESDNDSGGGGGGDDKIVCTAMNEEYGFGSYRNAIWLKYSQRMTKEHEIGYHAIFRPLLRVKAVRPLLYHIARHRTADLRAEMYGKKRDRIGQAWRFVLEPLCYIVGKLKGK